MFQKLLLAMILFIVFGDQGKAIDPAEEYVMTRGGLDCNGPNEGDDCETDRFQAGEMYDKSQGEILKFNF